MKKDRKERGFTLIELMAVIIILCLVIGLVSYVVVNVMNTSKKKSYQVIINDVEATAEVYLVENKDKLEFIVAEDNVEIEYQCVSIRELIETGYFKYNVLESKVNDNRNVELDDYVYVERNSTTKAVIKKEFLIDDNSVCNDIISDTRDKIPPVISIDNDLRKLYGTSFSLYEGVTITDNSGKATENSVFYNNEKITDIDKFVIGENIVTYKAVDKSGNESSVSRKIILFLLDAEYDYKEEEQIYLVEADGTYIIDAYGAQGGNSGGLGGHVRAELNLKTDDKLYINTGGINGYNGGGGYGDSNYYPGGGATTVKYNDELVVIAAGGGATGETGTGGAGGEGTGEGAESVGADAGLSGINGSGGSSSPNYNYTCNCSTCGGGCKTWSEPYGCCQTYCDCVMGPYSCGCYNCFTCCLEYYPTYTCNCKTCTTKGKSGMGGSNNVVLPAVSIESNFGSRENNGYVKISYKLEN